MHTENVAKDERSKKNELKLARSIASSKDIPCCVNLRITIRQTYTSNLLITFVDISSFQFTT